ncbi:MAG: ABC transporter ATP-binding protein [Pseudomonadota bacterium]
MPPLLAVSNLSKSFGAVKVADNLSFNVAEGEALGILGPNGAGKTSLFNLLTGALRADHGTIHFRNNDITHTPAATRTKNGIARSFQIPKPFVGMTVFENCLVAATQASGLSGAAAQQHAISVLKDTGLIAKANHYAGQLTLLDRKRLEMARALSTRPSLLLLDEIAGGLTEAECQSLIDSIKKIQAAGTTIIWIEHVMHALMAVVEKLIVLDFGKKIAEGDPHTTIEQDAVKAVYLGVE